MVERVRCLSGSWSLVCRFVAKTSSSRAVVITPSFSCKLAVSCSHRCSLLPRVAVLLCRILPEVGDED
jgi:hypothetical protein